MKNVYKLFVVASVVFGGLTSSCNKYLDIVPDSVGTLDYAFRNRNEAENYLFGCYSTMQKMSDAIYNPGFTTSAEVIYPILETQYFNSSGFNLIRGIQTSGNPILADWSNMYKAIRRCNIMLENMDKPIDLRDDEKKRWTAETKFLKAYYHYRLIRMYGPVVLIKENNPVDVDIELTKRKRATLDESFEYVISLMDEAIPDLPTVIENKALEFGRIAKFMAMSIKAEMLVTAASPLFNGNADYTGFKDKDGRVLFPQTYDVQKWVKAAEAAKLAIEECEKIGMRLSTEVPTANINNVSPELKQILALQHVITQRWEESPELIWAMNFGFGYQGYTMPKLTGRAVAMSNTYPSNWAVPINMTEIFYTENGLPIAEDKNWNYNGRFELKAGDEQHTHLIRRGYETVQAHFHRERRFYASIGFDGGMWFGNGVSDEDKAQYVQGRGPTGLAGPKSLNARNITGYWPKKLVHYMTVMDEQFTPTDFKIPMMRLAGLYLLYAEALNEAQANPSQEVYDYIDKVRVRAGIPKVRDAWANFAKVPGRVLTRDGLRQIIRQERRIELSFEGQSGWDLRRWKELQNVLSRPLQGWNVNGEDAVSYYRPVGVLSPIFGLRDYLWPLNNTHVVINENLTQNPYW